MANQPELPGLGSILSLDDFKKFLPYALGAGALGAGGMGYLAYKQPARKDEEPEARRNRILKNALGGFLGTAGTAAIGAPAIAGALRLGGVMDPVGAAKPPPDALDAGRKFVGDHIGKLFMSTLGAAQGGKMGWKSAPAALARRIDKLPTQLSGIFNRVMSGLDGPAQNRWMQQNFPVLTAARPTATDPGRGVRVLHSPASRTPLAGTSPGALSALDQLDNIIRRNIGDPQFDRITNQFRPNDLSTVQWRGVMDELRQTLEGLASPERRAFLRELANATESRATPPGGIGSLAHNSANTNLLNNLFRVNAGTGTVNGRDMRAWRDFAQRARILTPGHQFMHKLKRTVGGATGGGAAGLGISLAAPHLFKSMLESVPAAPSWQNDILNRQ